MKFTTLAELIDYFGSEPAPNGTAMLAALRELVAPKPSILDIASELEAAAQALADRPLDVERLARAVEVHQQDFHHSPCDARCANNIAAEYALLASPSPEP